MTKSERTKAQLVACAQHLFWSRGYSNVSLRDITSRAGVDVALVSRYFGSKRGLFVATLDLLPTLDTGQVGNASELVEMVVEMFATADRSAANPSPTTLILTNALDAEVGDLVRDAYAEKWQKKLAVLLASKKRAATFSAAMLGMSVAEKALRIDGIEDHRTDAYREQLRIYLTAAISD